MRSGKVKMGLAIALAVALVGGIVVVSRAVLGLGRIEVVAYFDNTNGLYRGDEVRILGVQVGGIADIEPQPDTVKVTFWVDANTPVPAEATAAIISPQLVTSRAIQLTPAYTGGPLMGDGAVIPQSRTAVPLEWDDLREQLEKLSEALQPTEPGGVSTLGAFVNTAADNLRGQGVDIREAVINMSRALSALGDGSKDMFTTIKNLSVVVAALEDSAMLLAQLNGNFAAVTGLLARDSDAVGNAVNDIYEVVDDATAFIADNREVVGSSSERLASILNAVGESLDDVEQSLHLFPNTFQNFINIYQPTQQGITGALQLQNFANPISFICGAVQAASRLGAEQSAKLCAQYLAPIVKNRQYNFFPLGMNYVVGAAARPNELTYSEDWLRPDHVPESPEAPVSSVAPLPAEAIATDPEAGISGLMVPPGGGS